uniref:Uncharacterized protein n=1 Tax=Arundo donax TaxID=35708 RepID=A0A0A9DI60_ARUDO
MKNPQTSSLIPRCKLTHKPARAAVLGQSPVLGQCLGRPPPGHQRAVERGRAPVITAHVHAVADPRVPPRRRRGWRLVRLREPDAIRPQMLPGHHFFSAKPPAELPYHLVGEVGVLPVGERADEGHGHQHLPRRRVRRRHVGGEEHVVHDPLARPVEEQDWVRYRRPVGGEVEAHGAPLRVPGVSLIDR